MGLPGLESAHAQEKNGAPFKMTSAKLRLAIFSVSKRETVIGSLCKEIGSATRMLHQCSATITLSGLATTILTG